MIDLSVLIGGKAGFGIDKASMVIARMLNQLALRLYIYRDYPSLIRGGHTFSIIRASDRRVAAHRNKVDFILALDQDTFNFHKDRLNDRAIVIYDPDAVKLESLKVKILSVGIPIASITKEENAAEITRNSCVIGSFAKSAGIKWEILEGVFVREFAKETELNIRVARRGFDLAKELIKIEPLSQEKLPLVAGNEAVSLGLVKAGLKAYIAYPMTPSSPILHYLADAADNFDLKVLHPESEIAVILMALGFSYMGQKAAVGTSGGGFCLMTEGLSFTGMAELPVVIIVGQRPGPSTGLPTYSSQTELNFVSSAGQGEFPRLVVAPADAEQAFFLSAQALNVSWKFQIPAIILTDKNMGEGVFNFDPAVVSEIKEIQPLLWDRATPYKRYLNTENGVSPLAFASEKDAVVKINSYEHDECGITTEEPDKAAQMQDKRLRKVRYLQEELDKFETVKVYGAKDASVALVCWGSTQGVCVEAAENLSLKVIQPLVIMPFPAKQFQRAIVGVKKLVCVEANATAQLAQLIKTQGFSVDANILKYDGRPFSLEDLEERIQGVLK